MKKNSNVTETFGSYIRRLRIENDIGQRELAKKIGVEYIMIMAQCVNLSTCILNKG